MMNRRRGTLWSQQMSFSTLAKLSKKLVEESGGIKENGGNIFWGQIENFHFTF